MIDRNAWSVPVDMALLPTLICLVLGALLSISTLWRLPNERLNVIGPDITPHTIQLYEWQTGNIGTTIRAEYLPKTALPWPRIGPVLLGQPPSAYLVSSVGQIDPDISAISATLARRTPAQQEWQIDVRAEQVTFTLPLLAAPGWVDASASPATAVQAYAGSGWVLLTRPRGTHRVVLRYVGTSLQHAGETIALVCAALLLIMAVLGIAHHIRDSRRALMTAISAMPIQQRFISRRWLIFIAGIVVSSAVALFILLITQTQYRLGSSLNAIDATARLFPHRGPLTLGTTDNKTYSLIHAQVQPQQIRAGESFTVSLRWADATVPLTITAKLELPPPSAYAVNQRVFRYHADPLIGDARQFTMPVTPAALPGPTLIRLSLSDDRDSVFIIGPTVIETPPNAPTYIVHVFSNGIALHQADLLDTSDQDICVRANWSRTPAMANRADALQVSFRIMDTQGALIAQADGQPQAGLAPIWAWPVGALIEDSYCGIPIKRQLREGESVTVQIIWYRLQSLEELDRVLLHGVWVNTHQRAVELVKPYK